MEVKHFFSLQCYGEREEENKEEDEGCGRVGSVASNRLCFLPCKRLMCAERSDTDECKVFAVKTLRPF